ncbi:MAG: hypothetical protein O2960_29285 [Verrucomicrobia bacterium]|nr:hypothetical protein [Verrucomicrobiota bacterium]
MNGISTVSLTRWRTGHLFRDVSMSVVCLFAVALTVRSAQSQLQIQFDYRFDTSGFFDDPDRRSVLNAAANEFTSLIADSLSPISPSGSNTWNALVIRPDTGTMELLSDLTIPANTITVFAGARILSADTLGLGEVGGLSLMGDAEWRERVRIRGQSGAPLSDFGPWGGSIGFDSSSTTTWHFDLDPLSLDDLPPDADDFFTVAQHELGHLLGFGSSASWGVQIDGGLFTGSNASIAFGEAVPVDSSGKHWADGTVSRIFGSGIVQEPLMAPELASGTRKFLTALDIAGLEDVGWTVVPEPGYSELLLAGLGMIWLGLKSRRSCSFRLLRARTNPPKAR